MRRELSGLTPPAIEMLNSAAGFRRTRFVIKGLSLRVKSTNPQGPETIAPSESEIRARSAFAPSRLSRKAPGNLGFSAARFEGETVR